MKQIVKQAMLSGAVLAGLAAAVACGPAHVGFYAQTAPPPIRVEAYGPAPGPGYVWINGYWGYRGNSYFWNAGRWDRPPRGRHRWEQGRWDNRGGRYAWREGRWR